MENNVWLMASAWMALALVASLVSIRVGISVALIEILVGVLAGNFAGLHTSPWIDFLATFGSGLLTFLAGAEIDPGALERHLKPALAIGSVSFVVPFLAGTAFAYWVAHWTRDASWIAGIALSTTSVAVVYAVMIETGLNRTEIGKLILAACFIFLVLFLLGGLAKLAQSEAVLPAYLVGLVIAGVFVRDRVLMERMRAIAFTMLTPFYFLKAGLYVSLPAVAAGALLICAFLAIKLAAKLGGIWPLTRRFAFAPREGAYTTLLMSTGLTFGTISALFGLTNHIIDQSQYTILVTTVIASAVVPTLIAQRYFAPIVPEGAATQVDPAPATADNVPRPTGEAA